MIALKAAPSAFTVRGRFRSGLIVAALSTPKSLRFSTNSATSSIFCLKITTTTKVGRGKTRRTFCTFAAPQWSPRKRLAHFWPPADPLVAKHGGKRSIGAPSVRNGPNVVVSAPAFSVFNFFLTVNCRLLRLGIPFSKRYVHGNETHWRRASLCRQTTIHRTCGRHPYAHASEPCVFGIIGSVIFRPGDNY